MVDHFGIVWLGRFVQSMVRFIEWLVLTIIPTTLSHRLPGTQVTSRLTFSFILAFRRPLQHITLGTHSVSQVAT